MSISKFKTGQSVRINMPGNLSHGQKKVLGNYHAAHGEHGWYTDNNTLWFYESQLLPLDYSRDYINETIAAAKQQQESINKLIDKYHKQLAYLDETGQETFEETEFKAYYALKVLEQNGMSTVERAKAIADLINTSK